MTANYDQFKEFRKKIKDSFGLHASAEMHTMHFLRDKGEYRKYGWTLEERKEIIKEFVIAISKLKIKTVNVIIDKNNIRNNNYSVLENALTYNIQRIENDSKGLWNYIIISDPGRIGPMRQTARRIRAFNPVQSHFGGVNNQPIKGLIEDIMEKDSSESYFIQLSDFISCFVYLYYRYVLRNVMLPSRIGNVIDTQFVCWTMDCFEKGGILNTKASSNKYGLVVYPK